MGMADVVVLYTHAKLRNTLLYSLKQEEDENMCRWTLMEQPMEKSV